jgi:hypothetical protein
MLDSLSPMVEEVDAWPVSFTNIHSYFLPIAYTENGKEQKEV